MGLTIGVVIIYSDEKVKSTTDRGKLYGFLVVDTYRTTLLLLRIFETMIVFVFFTTILISRVVSRSCM